MGSNKHIRIFDGATAIITGGASGIGRALAEELAKRGCEVVLADLQIELAEEVASKINASGGKAEAMKVDQDVAEENDEANLVTVSLCLPNFRVDPGHVWYFPSSRLPDRVFGLRYQSLPFDNVRFVHLTQGSSFCLAKT